MPKIYLIEGPVGSGKSTFAEKLALDSEAPHLNLDAWMANLFSKDRPCDDVIPWYIERKERCIEQIWLVTKEILSANCNAVLELGLIQRSDRYAFYHKASGCEYELDIYVVDAPREVRRERVRQRNLLKGPTYAMDVSDDVFELASDMWQAPDEHECSNQNITFIDSAEVV